VTQTKAELVYSSLRQQILSGQLAPGERLVIRRLGEQHQISDIPVREALKMLERDGLIRFVPYGGATVIELTSQEIKESILIRSRLEGLATRLAIPGMTYSAGRELRQMIEQMDDLIEQGNYQEYGLMNKRFHQYIYSLSPYPKLNRLIEDTWDVSARMRAVFVLVPERAAISNAEHRAILDALERGDEDCAERLAQEHKWHTAETLIDFIEKSTTDSEIGNAINHL
jgi:DNA-binding GntR family transcriptional regulator